MEEETTTKLPKGAEGRDIPSGTKVSYDAGGNQYEASRSTYSVLRDYGNWEVVFVTGYDRYASETPLKPPGSRGKLKEDLKTVGDHGKSSSSDNPVCRYTNMVGKPCGEREFYGKTNCIGTMCAGIPDRICKLRGEGK